MGGYFGCFKLDILYNATRSNLILVHRSLHIQAVVIKVDSNIVKLLRSVW